ncbi:MAG: archaeosortase/exosortase family protein [Deltaproteobacteria bacterium]|nr:archaeosortase/exosortase family protein [Deltaproteobacteria bacterium]
MKQSEYIKVFIRSNRKAIRFFLFFVLLFVVGQALYNFVYPLTLPYLVHKFNAEAGSMIINLITPDEKSFVQERAIRSGRFLLQIGWGCEGTEGMLILLAGIWAFQMSIKRKLLGSLIGVLILYIFNLIRIVVLYYLLKYKPDVFDLTHIYIGQIFLILIAFIFFIWWTSRFGEDDGKDISE